MEAIITAAGPMPESLAADHPQPYKCQLEVNGRRLIDISLEATRAAARIDRLIVVGPPALRSSLDLGQDDRWVDDQGSGSANFLAGLDAAADQEQAVFIASDVPFLRAAGLDDLVARAPTDRGLVLPIYRRPEIEAALPEATNKYVKCREGDLTASSVMVVSPRRLAERRARVESVFGQRKNYFGLFRQIGLGTAVRFALSMGAGLRALSVPQLESAIGRLLGFPVGGLFGCDPAFNFDIDHDRDWAECQALAARRTGHAAPG